MVTPKLDSQVKGLAPPTEVASSPSQSAEEPVRSAQVASLLPKETTLLVSIAMAAVVEVAKVRGEEVAI
jgi:hypothetical protein